MSFVGACSVDAGIRTASAQETHGLKIPLIDPLAEMHIIVTALDTGLDGLRVIFILCHIKNRDQHFQQDVQPTVSYQSTKSRRTVDASRALAEEPTSIWPPPFN